MHQEGEGASAAGEMWFNCSETVSSYFLTARGFFEGTAPPYILPSPLSGSPTLRLPGASFPSADSAAALLLLASEAWVGVSRRLRTPPSTVLTGGLRATRPRKEK